MILTNSDHVIWNPAGGDIGGEFLVMANFGLFLEAAYDSLCGPPARNIMAMTVQLQSTQQGDQNDPSTMSFGFLVVEI